jgi:hypothetical protein
MSRFSLSTSQGFGATQISAPGFARRPTSRCAQAVHGVLQCDRELGGGPTLGRAISFVQPKAFRHSRCEGDGTMCDYSLQHVASAPAKVGDRLVTTEFRHSGTRGFSEIGSPDVAICLRPGSELAFDGEVAFVDPTGLLPRRGKIAGGVARFRQVNLEQPYAHHDALEFPDGRLVLLTDLTPGQTATVLQLPPTSQPGEKRVAAEAPHETVAAI